MLVQKHRPSKLSGAWATKLRKHEVVNEIKKLYFSGVYYFNTPNDYRGFWAIQRMLIEEREIYFLVGMTLVASFIGAGISLFLLSPVFTSLGKLKEHAKRVADKDFPLSLEVQGPVEFQQLGQAFNEMSHDCRPPLIPWKKANEKRA